MKTLLKISAVIFAVIFMVQSVSVCAAKAGSVSIKTPKNVAVGEQFEVDITADGREIYGINGQITFNSSNLKLENVSPALAGNWYYEINTVGDTVYFAAADEKQTEPIKSVTDILNLTFILIGDNGSDTLIKVSNVSSSDKTALYSIPSAESNISFTPIGDNTDSNDTTEEGISYNNKLASLIVKNAKITPDFNPDIKEYSATVPFKIDELQVEAVPEDEKSTVNIIDTKLKFVGKNIVRVQVLSESGLKRTYKIYVTRQDKPKNSKSESNGFPKSIIMILAGALVIVAAVVVLVILFIKKKRKKQS